MSDESDLAGTVPQERRLQNRLLRLRAQRQETERHRVANESINTLLSVVKYLNSVQDGDALRIDATYSRTEIDKPSRILNCHEEDIMNASLIAMKRLIVTLIPPHADVQQASSLTAVDPVPATEQ